MKGFAHEPGSVQGFALSRAFSIARKEARHIRRDPLTLALALGLPLLLVTFFGTAIDFDVREVRMLAYDGDNTRLSRRLIETFPSSGFFKVREKRPSPGPLKALDAERASVVLIAEPGLARDWNAHRPAQVQIVLDGADNSTAGVVLGYLSGIQRAALLRLERPARTPVQLKTRFLFNPELNSRWFVVPGLIVVVISILSVLLTALTIAREWETGSMELLLSTPVRPLEIILGKLAPYLLLGLAGVLFVYAAARLLFGVPFAGSNVFFWVCTLAFLGTTLAQGLLISVVTRQQQLAMQLSIVSGLLPSILLSGFIFSIENMSRFFQFFTAILPARWFMILVRGIFLKGAGPLESALPLSALLVMNGVLLAAATRRFKADLEP